MELYLIRHGETAWTTQARYTSRTDLPLTDHGRAEAVRAREVLQGLAGPLSKLDSVSTSPMKRAVQTCALIFDPPVEPVVSDLLTELDFGDFEGCTGAEAQERRPGWDLGATAVPRVSRSTIWRTGPGVPGRPAAGRPIRRGGPRLRPAGDRGVRGRLAAHRRPGPGVRHRLGQRHHRPGRPGPPSTAGTSCAEPVGTSCAEPVGTSCAEPVGTSCAGGRLTFRQRSRTNRGEW